MWFLLNVITKVTRDKNPHWHSHSVYGAEPGECRIKWRACSCSAFLIGNYGPFNWKLLRFSWQVIFDPSHNFRSVLSRCYKSWGPQQNIKVHSANVRGRLSGSDKKKKIAAVLESMRTFKIILNGKSTKFQTD